MCKSFRFVDEGEGELTAEILRHLLEVPLVPDGQDHLSGCRPGALPGPSP